MKLFETKQEKEKREKDVSVFVEHIIKSTDDFITNKLDVSYDTWEIRIMMHATFYSVTKLDDFSNNDLKTFKNVVGKKYPMALKYEYQQFFINMCNELDANEHYLRSINTLKELSFKRMLTAGILMNKFPYKVNNVANSYLADYKKIYMEAFKVFGVSSNISNEEWQ